MKQLIVLLTVIILASCRGGENKAGQSGEELAPTPKTDTIATPKQPDKTPAQSGQSRGAETTEPSEILASIDKHLVSTAQFKAVPGGGITDCLVTVTNTLPDVSFQKALVEVTIKKADGALVKTDYYTVVNIDPGMSKTIKVPNNNQGSSVTTAVVKVKSTELTNGEFVLAGTPR
ncbi:MAG TPA: hypothetical protein VGO58_14595 [Chitinophagaceae bacterium]|jgi:hypothetical protein|nr:hypothetical protein [Chitinophagaceae bacterium]